MCGKMFSKKTLEGSKIASIIEKEENHSNLKKIIEAIGRLMMSKSLGNIVRRIKTH